MKKETITLIKNKLQRELDDIRYDIRKTTREINRLAENQRTLKEARMKLTELINQIK